jgi:hypothetical protein
MVECSSVRVVVNGPDPCVDIITFDVYPGQFVPN